MIPPASVISAQILALPKAPDPLTGSMNFAGVIGNAMALIQAGATGTPGILTFNVSIFGNLTAAMPPDPIGVWGSLMAANWNTALLASIITPGTVTSPIWTASSVDVATLPTAAATIITAPAAMAALSSKLSQVKADKTAPLPLAQAFHDAFGLLEFLCIGLTFVGPVPTPTPIPFGAI
jgi:hypothetical protein